MLKIGSKIIKYLTRYLSKD